MGSHHDVSDTKEDEEPLLKTTGEVATAKEAPPSVAGGHFGSVVGGGFTHYSGVCVYRRQRLLVAWRSPKQVVASSY